MRGRRRASPAWAADYPDADLNFSARFHKLTGLPTDPEGKILALFDAELPRYPFIYMAEGGVLELNSKEVDSLQGYLQQGGFLLVDDFWGEEAWANLRGQMKKVFPDRDPVELPMSHPIFHCFYELSEKPQVPNVGLAVESQKNGVTWERPDANEVHIRGLFDERNRLIAVFCHNTDLGDGWENIAVDRFFYREFTLKKAYPLGINIVVFALSQ